VRKQKKVIAIVCTGGGGKLKSSQ